MNSETHAIMTVLTVSFLFGHAWAAMKEPAYTTPLMGGILICGIYWTEVVLRFWGD